MKALLLEPRRLICPNGCPTFAIDTVNQETKVPIGGGAATMHACRAFSGLDVPLVPEGIAYEGRAVDRGDYVNGEKVQVHDDRPVMAYEIVRDEGTDCAVYAPCASASGAANDAD